MPTTQALPLINELVIQRWITTKQLLSIIKNFEFKIGIDTKPFLSCIHILYTFFNYCRIKGSICNHLLQKSHVPYAHD
ncbi:hypothetical protein DXA38_16255 [[Clostridium] innocuum]|uniref:Transposase n=1 Tax=Clostridium innocuum TaxID=1522 RepID=A0A3E2VNX5_CLOIN|nr:hypothetical protein DXA38_16255 [[Clostridium] innocuum]